MLYYTYTMRPKLIIVFLGIGIIAVLIMISLGYTNKSSSIADFESCVAAGNPIAESYPRQCFTSDGKGFVEVLDSTEPTFCTMDAKVCPDGSSVGRVPPDCEFALCPGE